MTNTPSDLVTIDLNLQPNEASGLWSVRAPEVLAAAGWDLGLWTILDEGPVEARIALIGHRADAAEASAGWECRHLAARQLGQPVRTQDTESVAGHDGWVYLFGSHFGAPDIGLAPDRQFVARFREVAAAAALGTGAPVEVAVVRDKFRLHRAVNDALRASKLDLWPVGPRVGQRFIERARKQAQKNGKGWGARVLAKDWPLNIEGIAFRSDGRLLVGLRFPCTAAGHPLLVEIQGVQAWFDDPKAPVTAGPVWVLDNVGAAGEPAGVRDLELTRQGLHVLTGNLDAELLVDSRKLRKPPTQHWRLRLPARGTGGPLKATFVRDFPGVTRLEGLAVAPDGRVFYVSDEEDRVLTRFTAVGR